MYKETDITTTVELPNKIYRTPWCEMLDCCSTNNGKVLHFWYPLKDLAQEVDMLTATLGKHRATEDAPHLLDLINMTYDENMQFISFSKTVMAELFQTICKYTKGLTNAYLFDEVHEDDEENECFNHSIHYVVSFPATLNANYIPALDTFLFDSLKNGVIMKWLHYAYPDEEKSFKEMYLESMAGVKDNASRLNKIIVDRIPRVF